jgi:hypothetical protein
MAISALPKCYEKLPKRFYMLRRVSMQYLLCYDELRDIKLVAPRKELKKMSAHTPEPWMIEQFVQETPGSGYLDCTGCIVTFDEAYGPMDAERARAEADARRIVACVNALAGIPTKALEAGALGEALRAVNDVEVRTRPGGDMADQAVNAVLRAILAKLGVKP